MGWDWLDWSKKQIAVETQRFQYGAPATWRIRQTAAMSLIRLKNSPRKKATNDALALSGGHAQDFRPMNIEGGHLIGIKLGGVDDAENVAPMYSHVNRNTFSLVEQQIVSNYQTGQGMGIVVRVFYPADPTQDGRIPDGFAVQLYRDMVLDQNTPGQFNGTAVGGPIAISNLPQAVARTAIDPHVKAHLDLAKQAVARGWKIEDAAPETRDWIATRKLPPVNTRPYAHLDFLATTDPGNVLLPIPYDTVGGGMPFSENQRKIIQQANRYGQAGAKTGECWSDVQDDPHQCALIQIGTDTGIEIDHIMPMRPTGSNAFSNAQVVSAGYNRSKSNTV